MKRVFQLAFVCFLALVIMSCGGGGSSSGVDQATDELDQLAASYARPGEDGSEDSSSSSTTSTSSTSSSTTTSSSSSTSSTSSSAYEGYVNKYADLLRVYNARGGSQTKSAWGKTHYCNSGRNEGRTYSGLSAASCSSTTTTATTTSASSTVLNVISPNRGQSWTAGSTYNITWDKGNAGSYVKIYLYKSGNRVSTISSFTNNDGTYGWTIPSSTAASSLYRIRIDSYYGSSSDYSWGFFSIVVVQHAACGWTFRQTSTGKRFRYKDVNLHKALAVTLNDKHGYAAWGWSTKSYARSRALSQCQKNNSTTCKIVDVDGDRCG